MVVCKEFLIFLPGLFYLHSQFNKNPNMKKFYTRIIPMLLVGFVLVFAACQKNMNEFIDTKSNNPNQGTGLATRARSSISGFVTNENDQPVI